MSILIRVRTSSSAVAMQVLLVVALAMFSELSWFPPVVFSRLLHTPSKHLLELESKKMDVL